ncbi:transcriptional regulator [Mesorhizobium sp. B2-3-7]|nr:transcriptional regulator [Mesorhizobium sp. B2-3-8]TPM15492.1 transcriptional regulator [Mesorhizobium sp. B2-3-7]
MRQRVHACLECGGPRSPKAEFCSAGCRTDFNNRRKARGAELHDLYMAHRFDRANAKTAGVLQAMNRMASNWREEDKARRDGRRSWRATSEVLAERPYLRGIRGQA